MKTNKIKYLYPIKKETLKAIFSFIEKKYQVKLTDIDKCELTVILEKEKRRIIREELKRREAKMKGKK
jgi:hypothetical protein